MKRAYLEAGGTFSIYEQEPPQPGLSVLPSKDTALRQAEPIDAAVQACQQCGHTEPTGRQPAQCPRCGHSQWASAVNKL